MTKTSTLLFLFAWALMLVGYLLGMLEIPLTMFFIIYYLDKKMENPIYIIWVLHLRGKYEKKIGAISVPKVFLTPKKFGSELSFLCFMS